MALLKNFSSKTVTKLWHTILKIVITLFLVDWCIQWHDLYNSWRENNELRSIYPWSLYSVAGEKISTTSGFLELEIAPLVTYQNRPNQDKKFFSTDENGFRKNPLQPADPKQRVVLLGASTAFGTGLPSNRDALGAQLSTQLNAEVINMSVIGYQSSHEAAMLLGKALALQPNIIIVVDGWNDLAFNIHKANFYAPDQTLLQIDQQLVRYSYMTSSYLLVRTGSALLHTLFPSFIKYSSAIFPPYGKEFADVPTIVAHYVDNQVKMRDLAKNISANFVHFIQPDSNAIALKQGYKPSTNEFQQQEIAQAYNTFVPLAQNALISKGIQSVYLGDYSQEIKDQFFMDSIHLNPDGNKAMAEVIAKIYSKKFKLSEN
jgi:lysophospholipase L1-like esterase